MYASPGVLLYICVALSVIVAPAYVAMPPPACEHKQTKRGSPAQTATRKRCGGRHHFSEHFSGGQWNVTRVRSSWRDLQPASTGGKEQEKGIVSTSAGRWNVTRVRLRRRTPCEHRRQRAREGRGLSALQRGDGTLQDLVARQNIPEQRDCR
jgi:hypothetical protein